MTSLTSSDANIAIERLDSISNYLEREGMQTVVYISQWEQAVANESSPEVITALSIAASESMANVEEARIDLANHQSSMRDAGILEGNPVVNAEGNTEGITEGGVTENEEDNEDM